MRKSQKKAGRDPMDKGLGSFRKEKADVQRSLNQKETILNGLPAGLLVIQQGRIIEANEEILNQLGYSAKEVLGRDFKDFVPPRLKTSLGGLYGRAKNDKGRFEGPEIELIGRDGTRSSWDVQTGVIRANGRRASLVLLLRNEERKKRQSQRVEDLKTGALRTMALGVRRALKAPPKSQSRGESPREVSEPGRRDASRTAEDALRTMESLDAALECLVREIPDGSRCATFDLRRAVKEALAPATARVKQEMDKGKADIRIKTYLRSVSPVEGDPEEIRQMVSHLVTNALDAMPAGGYLFLSTEENAGYAHLYVQDSGVGIPPEIGERVLDPFYTTKGPETPGLGLSLCRAIVRRHRGEMEISSKKSEGTTVTVKLPLAKAEGRDKKHSPRRRSIKNARILIIEEDPLIGELLLQTLKSKGCRVTMTGSVADGLLQAGKKGFDLVVVGSVVSEVKGQSLVKRLKASEHAPPVALIGDYDNQEDVRAGRTPPADLVISRPIDMDQAIGRIAEILKSPP